MSNRAAGFIARWFRGLGTGGMTVAIVGWSLAPVAWFASTSLKSESEIAESPPTLLPRTPTLDAYRSLTTVHRIGRPFRSSAVVAVTTVAVTIPIATLAAYAFSRYRFPGRRWLLAFVLAVSMFPQVAIAHTLERWLYAIGWINTWRGLVVPYTALTLPLAIWLLTALFRDVPRDLEDAARLDGCGPIGALLRVFIPAAAPAIATAALLTFLYAWNEFYFASFVADRAAVRTLPVAIAQFQGRFWLPWAEVAAASIAVTAPLVLLVLALQRRITEGLVAGAVKG